MMPLRGKCRGQISESASTIINGGCAERSTLLHPNPAKPEPKIFVHYSPVIPLISGNPVTNISLIFLDRFVQDFPGK
uniref:Uncharacterized protein n=1 Tax=Candidatus Kentrum sp. UNK TaxID=2126344 RepID=A0A451AZ45_9GAMM|nr:MAG: hypothetical protein BECKUNK1418G_GA0071005_105714 [Candidatus Kentron sp. UNK]VFK71301.1 MAG: hypothetical protein BECKUNK1418H_GA0071006_105914 [Candidatus Kentron sp. UNK]